MSWKQVYNSKLVSVDEAISHIKSGDLVVVAHCAAEPSYIMDALVQNKDRYRDVEIFTLITMGNRNYANEEMESHFKISSIFASQGTRDAMNNGRGDYIPCFFHELPDMLSNRKVDVELVQVTPPDKHGYCSLGTSIDYVKPVSKKAKMIIAQVNDQMPRTLGDTFIHVNEINFFVEESQPLPELKIIRINEVEKQIGEYCASLINDGDTLQLGIGSIPDSVLISLTGKKNLGIHSEMISDGVVDLIESGVINNKCKKINNGKSIATFLMGTKKLYDFVDENPAVELYPVNYVNDPYVIRQNDNVVSINSCIQVDLFGQVVSESIGLTQFSGVGGQVDFIRGANMSKGGRAIIAMPSTAAKGKISRIVPHIDMGSAVTTSRNDVDYIVTEYGIAKLKGKSLKERARNLIEITHPNFRDTLICEYEKRFFEKY